MKKESKRGGKLKPPAQRKRNNLTFRARDQLKASLAAAAEINRRSLSEEIEHRLEKSFLYEQALGDVEEFKRRAVAAEAAARGYGTLHTPTGDRYFAPGTHNMPASGFITPQEAAAPQPAYGLPAGLREAIREEIRAALAEITPTKRKGAA